MDSGMFDPNVTVVLFAVNFIFCLNDCTQFSSVQFSHSVMSDSLRPHESQHSRPPCPSPSPRVHSDSHPSSQWCHPAMSSSVVPFSSCPQSLPASESFPMSQLFAWGGQSTGVSALALLTSIFMKVKVLVTQLSPTLCNSMDCSPPGSSVCGVFQARIPEWVAISFFLYTWPW